MIPLLSLLLQLLVSQMSSNFSKDELNQLIEGALDSSAKPIDRSYGQLGFMESDLAERIFNAFESHLGETDIINVIQDARIERSSALLGKLKITDLHTVVHNCKKCQSTGIVPNPVLPKWNTVNPDVLFVIDTPLLDYRASELFVSTMKSVGFSSSKVCLTYLVRCSIHPSAVQEEHVGNCSQYLHNEIQIMNPKLVCPVGANSLKILFGDSALIKDYKSKISWLGSWPILPLYSLSYVIKAGDVAENSFKADMLQAYQFCYQKGKQT